MSLPPQANVGQTRRVFGAYVIYDAFVIYEAYVIYDAFAAYGSRIPGISP
jgi:hypothetical protein